jgi:hypothetical protein
MDTLKTLEALLFDFRRLRSISQDCRDAHADTTAVLAQRGDWRECAERCARATFDDGRSDGLATAVLHLERAVANARVNATEAECDELAREIAAETVNA